MTMVLPGNKSSALVNVELLANPSSSFELPKISIASHGNTMRSAIAMPPSRWLQRVANHAQQRDAAASNTKAIGTIVLALPVPALLWHAFSRRSSVMNHFHQKQN